MAGALTAAIASIFSGSAVTPDPYYEYTTLLLPGSGTNGAQNNTFLDGSTNNFTITRNGNTTQGTFSPFSQTGWGNYFDGSTDYLTLTQSAFAVGTSNFTLEAWVYLTAAPTGEAGVISSFNTGGGQGFYLAVNGSRQPFATIGSGATSNPTITGSAISLNTWVHLAMVRLSGTIYLYVDGSSVGTPTSAGASIDRTLLGIGLSYPNSPTSAFITGYISNARVATVAVYTGNFTPPTSPLAATQSAGTNISAITGTQTSLLTCQSNRFIDNSTNNFTITRNGDTRVVAFSPFNPTASWSAATYGGSGYFDGNGDYLSAASNAAFTLGSSSDFCIEGWVYSTGTPGTDAVIAGTWQNGSSAFANRWFLSLRTSGTAIYWWDSTGSPGITYTGITTNQWVHIAVVRNSGTITLYVNGVSRGTQTTNQAYTTQDSLKVGGGITGTSDFPGYISSLRVVLGSPVYTSAFTPPTAPLTAITNTSLLLNFTNAGIYDATSKNDLETVGDAQISNAVTPKWGSTSIKFDGTGDYLQSPDSELVEFGSGDFTIETWVRFAALPSSGAYYTLVSKWDNSTQKSYLWYVYNLSGAYQLYFTYTTNGSTNINPIAAITPSINTWYHYAVSRSGANLRMFIDGTQVGSTYNIATDTIFGGTYPLQVGASTGANTLNGYMQDVRVTKGYARYTANFTAPTAAFPTL